MIIATTDYTTESIHANIDTDSNISYLHLKINDSLSREEVKKFIEAVKENIFTYLEDDEYIAFNFSNFFSEIGEIDFDLYDYIADYKEDDFFFIDYFDHQVESYYDEDEDEYYDEEDRYAGIEDHDSMSEITSDGDEYYYVKFIKNHTDENGLTIRVSNDSNTKVDMSSKVFLSLYC
jgi:hypothetical protein